MIIYHNEGFTRENLDTQCSCTITDTDAVNITRPAAPIEVKQMDAVPLVVSTILTDDFYKKVDGLTRAYNAISQWIEENDYQIAGPPRELFYGLAE